MTKIELLQRLRENIVMLTGMCESAWLATSTSISDFNDQTANEAFDEVIFRLRTYADMCEELKMRYNGKEPLFNDKIERKEGKK